MDRQRARLFLVILVVLAVSLSACGPEVSRNSDGSLKLETELSQSSVMDMLHVAFADTSIKISKLDFHPGYILVYGECGNADGLVQTMALRLEFETRDGKLATHITQASLHDKPVTAEVITRWNQAIENRLVDTKAARSGRQLEVVEVTATEMCLTWRLETPESSGE